MKIIKTITNQYIVGDYQEAENFIVVKDALEIKLNPLNGTAVLLPVDFPINTKVEDIKIKKEHIFQIYTNLELTQKYNEAKSALKTGIKIEQKLNLKEMK